MPFEVQRASIIPSTPRLEPFHNVFFGDVIGVQSSDGPEVSHQQKQQQQQQPLVGSWFRMEKGAAATAPTYEYNEVGVVFDGTVDLKDEEGHKATLTRGDVFFITRGSTVTFSSADYGVCFKCGTRVRAKL